MWSGRGDNSAGSSSSSWFHCMTGKTRRGGGGACFGVLCKHRVHTLRRCGTRPYTMQATNPALCPADKIALCPGVLRQVAMCARAAAAGAELCLCRQRGAGLFLCMCAHVECVSRAAYPPCKYLCLCLHSWCCLCSCSTSCAWVCLHDYLASSHIIHITSPLLVFLGLLAIMHTMCT